MATTKINTPELFELESSTSGVRLPSGTTAQRPSTNLNSGDFRYNTDDNKVEYYDGSNWFQIDDEALPPIPSENFNAVLYAGNGGTQSITGVGFEPDFVWIKERNGTEWHNLFNSVRGADKNLYSNETTVEATSSTKITSFDTDGFSLGSDNNVNKSASFYVAWCWKAGGSAVSNSDGTISTQLSANSNAGFSVGTYSGNNTAGATIGHGLNSAPELIIVKSLNSIGGSPKGWTVYAEPLGNTKYLYLDDTIGAGTYNFWNNTSPTASVISLSSDTNVNSSSGNYVFYAFHSVAGYQKIGTYTGTGVSGNVVETGFEPAFLLIKSTGVESWYMMDNKRLNGFYSDQLYANLPNSEGSGQHVRFLSNGFVLDTTDGGVNNGTASYIYLAFASDPTSTTPSLANSFKTNLYTGTDGIQTIGGHLNGSAQFNGSSSITTNLNLDTSSAFSWSCWINISDKRANGFISEILTTTLTSSPYNGLTLGIDSPNLALLAGGSNQGTIISNPNLGQWYHIVITYNGSGSIKCYVDSVTSVSITYTLAQGGTLGIGDGPVTSWSGYIGNIDQVRIFNSTLTDSQVRELYNETTATANTLNFPTGAGCVAAYPLDSNSNDLSGNYNGTDTSMTYSEGTSTNPSLVWIKYRNRAETNALYDSVRGAKNMIRSNGTNPATDFNDSLTSFNKNGFTLGADANWIVNRGPNQSSGTSGLPADYVAWNWGSASIPSANSDGTTATPSIVSANPSAGFSIVRYTSDGSITSTVGHGLGADVKLILQKRLNNTQIFYAITDVITGSPQYIQLDSTGAADITGMTFELTDSVFSNWESNGNDIINYCFANVSGYQKIGYYVGNDTTSNTIYTTDDGTSGGANGFEPGWVMIKRTDISGYNWRILDNTRSTSNPRNKELYPNLTNAEGTYSAANFNSTSFEIIVTDASYNALNGEYLYLVIK
tara:strand:- start:781 stop:3609 length:2829 start_codon:yes stop_codon:yes gene_type:complete